MHHAASWRGVPDARRATNHESAIPLDDKSTAFLKGLGMLLDETLTRVFDPGAMQATATPIPRL